MLDYIKHKILCIDILTRIEIYSVLAHTRLYKFQSSTVIRHIVVDCNSMELSTFCCKLNFDLIIGKCKNLLLSVSRNIQKAILVNRLILNLDCHSLVLAGSLLHRIHRHLLQLLHHRDGIKLRLSSHLLLVLF